MSDYSAIFLILIIALLALEVLGSYFFVSTIFYWGLPVINDKIQIKSFPRLTPKKRIKTVEGIFYLQSDNEIFFNARSTASLTTKRYEMPLKYKATLNSDGTADIQGRIPLSVLGIIVVLGAIFFTYFEWVVIPVVAIMFIVSYFLTKRKSETIIYDLEEILSRPEI